MQLDTNVRSRKRCGANPAEAGTSKARDEPWPGRTGAGVCANAGALRTATRVIEPQRRLMILRLPAEVTSPAVTESNFAG
jgi:hypothetical protein